MARADTARNMGPSKTSMPGIYLNDHLAGATAGTELAHRMARSHGDGQGSGTLRRLAAEIAQDRAALLDIEQATMAERAGFDALWISDHFHPWLDEQGQSSFVWSVIGAISQVTSLPITTAVTCPTTRIHPAIIAQAAATASLLTGGDPASFDAALAELSHRVERLAPRLAVTC